MRHIINKLQDKPDRHKKQVAFLASATLTLMIFGTWTLVNFGAGGVLSQNTGGGEVRQVASPNEVSPLRSVQTSLASSFVALQAAFTDLRNSVNPQNLGSEYQELRNSTLEIYYGD